MSDWKVLVIDEAVDELETLTRQMRAKFQHIAELIEDLGLPAIGEPHVKHIRDKLWEIRCAGGRAIYFVASG
jgi:phage-related protein